MAAPLTRVAAIVVKVQLISALDRGALRFTSQYDGYCQVSLNEDAIFKVECGCRTSHIGFASSEQVG